MHLFLALAHLNFTQSVCVVIFGQNFSFADTSSVIKVEKAAIVSDIINVVAKLHFGIEYP